MYELRPVLTPLLKSVAAEAGAVLRVAPVKDVFRALEKVVIGKKENVFDLLRFNIECIDMKAVTRVTSAIFENANFKARLWAVVVVVVVVVVWRCKTHE